MADKTKKSPRALTGQTKALVEKICGHSQAPMQRNSLCGRQLRGMDHACVLNTMTSAAILSAKPIGQRLKSGQPGG